MRALGSVGVIGTRVWPLVRCGFAAVFVAGAIAACGGPPAGYPDTTGVVSAQEAWCKSMAKVQGAGDSWDHMSSCKSFYPTASAAFLKLMAKCYADRVEAAGSNAMDSGQIGAECGDEVVVKMTPDDAAAEELIAARCGWQVRCVKADAAECKANFAKLEVSQRVMMTTKYNRAAMHKVASCLSSASCSAESEEAVFNDCYKPVEDELFWSP